MKKKMSLSEYKLIRNLVLYREDIEEIIHLLKAREMTVTISDSDFEYEKIDELIEHRGSCPCEISISGKLTSDLFDGVSISFKSDHTSVYSSGSGTPRELWFELISFLKKRRSWIKQIAKPLIWHGVATIAIVIELLIYIKKLYNNVPFWVHVVLLIAIASWPLSYIYSRALPTVRLTRRIF